MKHSIFTYLGIFTLGGSFVYVCLGYNIQFISMISLALISFGLSKIFKV